MENVLTIPIKDTPTKGPVTGYFSLVNRLLLSPRTFFEKDLPNLSVSEALSFGIVSAWIASVLAFFLDTLNSFILSQLFERWVQRLIASDEGFSVGLSSQSFLMSAGLLVIGPFLFLVRLFFGSLVLYTFVALLSDEKDPVSEPVTLGGVLRLQGAAFSSQWFCVVPIFGGLIAFVAHLVLLVSGVKARFGFSSGKALVAVLAPYFLLMIFLLLALVALAFALFQMPVDELLEMDSEQLFDGAKNMFVFFKACLPSDT